MFLRFEIDQVYQNDLVQGSLGCSSGCSSAGCTHEPTPTRTSGSSIYPAVQNMLLAARALGLGATLTTLYLSFEKEVSAALGLPPDVHSYALLPIGYPIGRFGPVRRVPLADVVFENRWGQPCRDL
jgi:nitroreductase